MLGQSYSKEIVVSKKPDIVYNAITKGINNWWTELSNIASKVGDQFTAQFENTTFWVMKISEALPNKSLVWEVSKANHNIEKLSSKDEWEGTSMRWEIEENGQGSKIIFTHNGLLPELECYEICERGWDYFLESLKNYIDNGKGTPYKNAISD